MFSGGKAPIERHLSRWIAADIDVPLNHHATMRIIATITEPLAVKKILSHLGMRTEPLPRARARDPTGQESFDFDAA